MRAGVLLLLLGCRTEKADLSDDTAALSDITTPDEDGDGYDAEEDCDDNSSAVHPDAAEVCDGIDNNCDGIVDEGVTSTYYADDDGDGFGDADDTAEACEIPDGHVATGTDCDDSDGEVWPSAPEQCDGIDNDCDGQIDEDVRYTWYADADGDGYGDADSAYDSCDPPPGYVTDATDCDDTEEAAFPGGEEVCDEVDNDCDGDTDENVTTTYYQDTDADGFGIADVTTAACDLPTGYAAVPGDCDDDNGAISPNAAEVCDGIDNDCDSDADSDAIDRDTFYADDDGDGFGDAATTTLSCEAPSGYTADSDDCDDTDAAISPDAAEVCNGVDDDCDGDIDTDATDMDTFYADSDGDGYGSSVSTTACEAPSGYADNDDDCDDGEAASNPGESEVCDDIDNDCDGSVDEGVTQTWYLDYDGDGYGDDDRTASGCEAPTSSYVADGGDCDEDDADIHPGATEGCDGIDHDCDGDIDSDADGDGYADAECGGDDCDDADASVLPEIGGGCALGVSCLDVQDSGYDDGDGEYTIDPDGYGTGEDPFDVWCDMTTDGGGWTFIANISDSDDDAWSEFMSEQDAGLWDSTDTLGEEVTFTADYKSAAYIHVDATSLLIKEAETNVLMTQSDCWSEQTFLDFISALSWSAGGSDYTWDDSSGAYLCDFEHFSYSDTVLRAGDHSGSERVVGFKWGEADGAQDGNKDRTMITTHKANGYTYDHHVDLPTGLGGFTSYSGSENYEDANECQGDGPDQCTNADQDYQLFVR